LGAIYTVWYYIQVVNPWVGFTAAIKISKMMKQ